VVIGLVAGALLLIVAEKVRRKITATTIDELSYKQALYIGLFQCLAIYPGFSRSGSTVSGGLLVGADHKTFAEFSFLIALPIMVGATGLDFVKSLPFLHTSDVPMFAIGFITAFVVAMMVAVVF
jgi:undecaprenyl-diphosphatase